MRSPYIRHLTGRIAAEIPLVGPEFLILIEVLRHEHVFSQRLHSCRWSRECRRIRASETGSPWGSVRLRILSPLRTLSTTALPAAASTLSTAAGLRSLCVGCRSQHYYADHCEQRRGEKQEQSGFHRFTPGRSVIILRSYNTK